MSAASDFKAPEGLDELGTGGSSGIPTRLLGILAVIIAIGTFVGLVFVNPEITRLDDEVSVHRLARCIDVPEDVKASLIPQMHNLGDRVPRGWSASRAGENSKGSAGSRIGGWFVSVELAPPTLAKGATGQLVTWIIPDRGDGTGPATTGAEITDRDGRELTMSPHAPSDVDLDAPGGVDSRWCAREVTRPS